MVMNISGLVYGGKLVGVRLSKGKECYDISINILRRADVLVKLSMINLCYGKDICMQLYGDTLKVCSDDNGVELSDASVLNKYTDDCPYLYSKVLLRYYLCMGKLLDIDIPLGEVVSVKVNPRLTGCWDKCIKNKDNLFRIEISELLAIGGNDNDLDITILHELLHTIKDCLNHGSDWKSYANRVRLQYGIPIELHMDKDLDTDLLLSYGYHVCKCIDCGQLVYRKSECDFIKHPEIYSCATCGGKFKRVV